MTDTPTPEQVAGWARESFPQVEWRATTINRGRHPAATASIPPVSIEVVVSPEPAGGFEILALNRDEAGWIEYQAVRYREIDGPFADCVRKALRAMLDGPAFEVDEAREVLRKYEKLAALYGELDPGV